MNKLDLEKFELSNEVQEMDFRNVVLKPWGKIPFTIIDGKEVSLENLKEKIKTKKGDS